jgi:glycosyltransferase involved in cell wall biosynthesis
MATEPHAHPAPRLVSVILPVRNGVGTIEAQLDALAAQTYGGRWEVIVADNGSTDGTPDVARRWASRLPALTVLDTSQRPGSSYARNRGAQAAAGELLAFCDADDVVAPQWLAALVAGAASYDAVTGPQEIGAINETYVQAWRPPRPTGLPRAGFLPYAPSCNLGVWATVFAQTGGFSEEYPQSHDVEWAWRAQLASFTLGWEPGAVVHYRYRTAPRAVWRQAYLSGVDAARLYRDYREHGMSRAPASRALRTWAWLGGRVPYVLSAERRGIWLRRAGEAAGRLAGSARFRVLFP